MRYSYALLALAAIATAKPVAMPQAVTQNITPSEPAPPGCSPTFVGSFGIAVAPLATAAPSPNKRALASTESCGPLTVAHVSQIGDGQIQAAIEHVTFLSVNQTGDCQFAPASELGSNGEHVAPVVQIGDGQLQAPVTTTATPKSHTAVAPAPTVTPVVPAPTSAGPPPPPPPPQTSSSSSTPIPPPPPSSVASPTPASTPEAPSPFAPAGGSSSAARSAAPATASPSSSVSHPYVICDSPGSLAITLEDGVLKDQAGRTGYIAANYQFQFDGPPQAGAIITAGFSVCNNGSLALGGTNVFYQCLSGNFYNLYDRSWAAQCSPVVINTLFITKC